MKYYVQTTKYVAKNFIFLLPFAIIPALFLAFSLNQESILYIYETIKNGGWEIDFLHIFRAVSLFNFADGWTIFLGALGVILLVPCIAMIMAFLEKHMRIGKRTLSGIFQKLNDNLLSTVLFITLIALVYQLWSLVTSAVFYLFTLMDSAVLAYVLAGVFFLMSSFGLVYVLSVFYLWLPCLQLTGFRPAEALRYSYFLVSPVRMGIVLSQFITLVVFEIVITLAVVLFSSWFISFIVAAAFYTIATMIFCVRMQVVYFDRAQIERADLRKNYFA